MSRRVTFAFRRLPLCHKDRLTAAPKPILSKDPGVAQAVKK